IVVFSQREDGIRCDLVTGVQTCALPIFSLATGAALIAHPNGALAATTAPINRTATDQVLLGNTGIRMSRIGIGTGSNNGKVQTEIGRASCRERGCIAVVELLRRKKNTIK